MFSRIGRVVIACLPLLTSARPFISYAALGDSYASGNGAGSVEGLLCGRFSAAYPVQVSQQLVLAFKNLACAGAFTTSVLYTQIPWVGNSDVVSMQVGGNEADFFSLLNECVQQWAPLSTCEREIARAKGIIESNAFISRYENLVSAMRTQFKPSTVLLVLGYAKFFNDETDQCDHVTFSRTNPQSLLSKEKRRSFNQIISHLNTVIRGAAEAHGALYVDIDKIFEGHRFCEKGIVEPAQGASWFFNDIPTSQSLVSVPTREQIVLAPPLDGFLNLTRTFHPTIRGHTAIADEIVQLLNKLSM